VRFARRSLGGGTGEARCDQYYGEVPDLNHFDKAGYWKQPTDRGTRP
jgi:hypothetical protein